MNQEQETLKEYKIKSYNLAMQILKNPHKALKWLKTPNPQLGDISPDDMINLGKGEKLINFMEELLK